MLLVALRYWASVLPKRCLCLEQKWPRLLKVWKPWKMASRRQQLPALHHFKCSEKLFPFTMLALLPIASTNLAGLSFATTSRMPISIAKRSNCSNTYIQAAKSRKCPKTLCWKLFGERAWASASTLRTSSPIHFHLLHLLLLSSILIYIISSSLIDHCSNQLLKNYLEILSRQHRKKPTTCNQL